MKKLLTGLSMIAFLTSCATGPADDAGDPASAKILEVNRAEIVTLDTQPPQIVIKASGKTSTPGWTDLRLVPTKQSRAGISEFAFVGRPPVGIVAQVVSPVTATYIVPPEITDLRLARIHAKANSVQTKPRP